ncbi:hypothetical protein V6N13_073919 [Hibiscus sabdariffa]|uniref:Uncharacterized protein n=1 Tax=Hibiscus sabdariffa TaxID=183260 RepID=A0ABR1Z7Z4_9ROSI
MRVNNERGIPIKLVSTGRNSSSSATSAATVVAAASAHISKYGEGDFDGSKSSETDVNDQTCSTSIKFKDHNIMNKD